MSQTTGISDVGARHVAWAVLWGVFCGTAGGFVCGLAVDRFGEMGSVSLWALGALGGYVARRITTAPSRLVGWTLVAACLCALVIAETCWIHWDTKQGSESWWAAFTLLPTFAQQYQISAIFASIFALFGAWSAYRTTAIA